MTPIFFAASNIIFWLSIVGLQYAEYRMGRIPHKRAWSRSCPKESFLYLEDWNTGSWGDVVGLSVLACAFGLQSDWPPHILVTAMPLSFLAIFLLHIFWKAGLPNAGYPFPGRVSLSGRLHLLYTWVQLAIFIALLMLVWQGDSDSLQLTFFAVGVLIYGGSFLCDFFQGKFSRIGE